MHFKLNDSDRTLLREIQQNEKHKKNYVKVTILLGLDKGNSPEDLMDLLGVSSSTFFEKLLADLPENAAIFFTDAVHPQHNTRSSYGWIAKGKEKEILSVSARKRVNINGAFSVQAPEEVIIVEAESINAENTWELYQKIETAHPEKEKIYVICDNARYHRNKDLQTKLQSSRIVQIFLPAYSPNLNLIERL